MLFPGRRLRSVCHAAKREVSKDGFEAHLATNYLGSFLLVLLLLPLIRKAVSHSYRGNNLTCVFKFNEAATALKDGSGHSEHTFHSNAIHGGACSSVYQLRSSHSKDPAQLQICKAGGM